MPFPINIFQRKIIQTTENTTCSLQINNTLIHKPLQQKPTKKTTFSVLSTMTTSELLFAVLPNSSCNLKLQTKYVIYCYKHPTRFPLQINNNTHIFQKHYYNGIYSILGRAPVSKVLNMMQPTRALYTHIDKSSHCIVHTDKSLY